MTPRLRYSVCTGWHKICDSSHKKGAKIPQKQFCTFSHLFCRMLLASSSSSFFHPFYGHDNGTIFTFLPPLPSPRRAAAAAQRRRRRRRKREGGDLPFPRRGVAYIYCRSRKTFQEETKRRTGRWTQQRFWNTYGFIVSLFGLLFITTGDEKVGKVECAASILEAEPRMFHFA